MERDFPQVRWDAAVAEECRRLVRLAIAEDLGDQHDWTTLALVPSGTTGRAAVVSRQPGVACGLRAAEIALHEMDLQAEWLPRATDGEGLSPGQSLGEIAGSARTLLAAERTLLNFIGRLSGIATLTRKFVDAAADSSARIYDTRKTTPGWRRLEKYAVACGGGHNHRLGLCDAILIKDNHLAFGAAAGERFSPAEAVAKAKALRGQFGPHDHRSQMLIEIEVDTLDQLDQVLPAGPDLVLLDNMPPELLAQAVARRAAAAPGVELEASGGVRLDTVAAIAATGVDRISAGAITHSAVWLDVGLDWRSGAGLG
jgi:nicotinate-nucleotide pyrophosphorylase (carboxylating)